MIQKTQEDLSLHIDAVVGDMGYISAVQKGHLRKQWQTAVLTKIRENMSPPKKNILIMAAPSARRDSLSLGMATVQIGRGIDISPLPIIRLVAFVVSREIATKKRISALPLMNTTLELFPFIPRLPRGYYGKSDLGQKGALRTIKTSCICITFLRTV